MTRNDYILIAKILHDARETEDETFETAVRLADALQSHPHFNREHFLAVVRGEKDLNSRPQSKEKS